MEARSPEHVYEGVKTELVDFSAKEVIHAGLSHAELPRRFGLGEPFGCSPDLRHELRAHGEVLRFARWEADVGKNIAAAAIHFELSGHHFILLSFTNAR